MLVNYVRLTLGSYIHAYGIKIFSNCFLEVTPESCYKNHIRITLGSCVRLKLGSYVIKPCKWGQKIT